jgi:aryl sulfotransferase
MSNLSKKFNNLKIVRDVRIDSTIWYDFEFRTDDIIIASYPKSGTTWMQQIIGQLIFNGRPGVNIAELSPWLEYRNPPKEENFLALSKQPHRRFIKTHLPAHSLYMPENIKYIYVVRDGRDVCLSLYNHHNRLKKSTLDILNDLTSAPDKPLRLPDNNFPDYFDSWIERNGYPYWSYWENIISWWKIRGNPNVRLVRYSDLLFNLEYSLIEIARFININDQEIDLKRILSHCEFQYMKENGSLIAPFGGRLWEGGSDSFFNKGINGVWKNFLTQAQSELYKRTAKKELGSECANWLNR